MTTANSESTVPLPLGRRGPLLGALVISVLAVGAARGQSRSPERILTEDFALVRSGQVWINRREVRLLARLEALPNLRARITDAEADLAQIVDGNEAAHRRYAALQQIIKRLERGRSGVPNGSQRKTMERELKRQRDTAALLKERAIEPARMGGEPSVRAKLVTLSNDRNALLLCVLWIRAAAVELDEEYDPLRNDPRVARALERLNGNQQVGPLRDYGERLAQLAPYEKLVFTSELPLYRLGDRLRVSLILGDQTPATFTWQESHESTVITASVAEAAGITAPDSAARVPVPLAGNRRVWARKVVVPYLRLGRHVVKDLPALLLPPEGEDLGSQIGPVALPGFEAVAEPARLRLVVRTAGDG